MGGAVRMATIIITWKTKSIQGRHRRQRGGAWNAQRRRRILTNEACAERKLLCTAKRCRETHTRVAAAALKENDADADAGGDESNARNTWQPRRRAVMTGMMPSA